MKLNNYSKAFRQLKKALKKLKKYSHWKKLGSQAIQNITERIDEGYQKFFKKQGGLPGFKKVKRYKSFTLKGKVGYKIEGNIISINGYKYKFFNSRAINGTIKTVTIKRDNIGGYYFCVTQEIPDPKFTITSGRTVGIDFGLKDFLTLSDNTKIKSPLFHLKTLKQIKKLNKNLSKKKKGSNNFKRAKMKLARLHNKVFNQRNDYLHKLSSQLASNYDTIFIEDLNIDAMKRLWGRKVSDLGFSSFVNMLSYKIEVIKVDKFLPSSKACSNCGCIIMKLILH